MPCVLSLSLHFSGFSKNHFISGYAYDELFHPLFWRTCYIGLRLIFKVKEYRKSNGGRRETIKLLYTLAAVTDLFH